MGSRLGEQIGILLAPKPLLGGHALLLEAPPYLSKTHGTHPFSGIEGFRTEIFQTGQQQACGACRPIGLTRLPTRIKVSGGRLRTPSRPCL